MPHILLLISILIFKSLSGQITLNPETIPSMPLQKELLGANTGLFYSDVMGERSPENVLINSYFSPELIKEIDSISLGHIRFPGGTSANYYHFYGRGGYGTDTFEMSCREGYLPNPSIVLQYGVNDGRHAENFAPRVKEMMQGLGNVNEKPNLHYVINIMTHFYYGDFLSLENGLNLMLLGRSKLLPFLFAKLNLLNPTQMDEIANELRLITVQNKALFDLTKSNFMKDAKFRKRLDENLAALHYYHDNGIPISHVEMGNEVYADWMLIDEDLSTIDFDCASADSTTNPENKLAVSNVQQYSLAMLKYYFITSIYEDTIKKVFPNIKTGLVLAPMRPNIVINENFETFDVPRGILSFNANYLWNKFISGFTHGNGLISHLYLQNLVQCEVHDNASADTIEIVFKAIFDHFINTSFNNAMELEFLSMNASVKKEHWLTEWNINGRNALSNTYLHAQFVLRFMLKILEWNQYNTDRKIDVSTYFNLSTFRNFNYCMLRTGYDENDVYHIEKQLLYYPIYYLSRAIQTGSKMLFVADSVWANNTGDSLKFYTFYHPDKEEIHLIYINYSQNNKTFSTDTFRLIIDGIAEPLQIHSLRLLQTQELIATDYGCPQITPAPETEAKVKASSTFDKTKEVILPALSFGEIILKKEEITTPVFSNKKEDFMVYPNPSKGNFYLQNPKLNFGNLIIYDISGKIIVSKANISLPTQIQIDVPSGTYFIEINDNNQRWQKKVIIAD